MVGVVIMILCVVICFELLCVLSSVCEIIVFSDLESMVWIIFFLFDGNMLMIWLMVLVVELVCSVLNIKWLVFVVVSVRWMVLRLCNLLISIMFGFLCSVDFSVLVNEWV